MSNIANIPCQYLAFSSGYTARLYNHSKCEKLGSFCKKRAVTPLFIFDPIWGSKNITPLTVIDGSIDLNAAPDHDHVSLCEMLYDRITQSGLSMHGIIVFRVENLDSAMNVAFNMKKLDYCNMYDVDDIKFIMNDKLDIDMMYVSFDAESG